MRLPDHSIISALNLLTYKWPSFLTSEERVRPTQDNLVCGLPSSEGMCALLFLLTRQMIIWISGLYN